MPLDTVIVRAAGAPSAVTTTLARLYADTSFDVKISAVAGDVIDVGAGLLWDVSNSYCYIDFAIIVSGSPVRYVSSGTITPSFIPGLFQTNITTNFASSGSMPYTVQAGDIVAGEVTFRPYAKVNSGTRNPPVSPPPYAWASKCPSGATSAAVTGTLGSTWTALGSTATIAATAGDKVLIKSSGDLNPSAAFGAFDVATIVSSAPANWVSSGSATHTEGVPAWRTANVSNYLPIGGGGVLYTVQEGDVASGNVTFRMYGKMASGSTAMDTGATFFVQKVAAGAAITRSTAMPNASGTSWSAQATDGTFDLSIAAAVGDILEIGLSVLSPSANASYVDVAVMGSTTNWVSTNTSSHTDGVAGWYTSGDSGQYASSKNGSILYTVQSGDVSAGNVTLRVYAKAAAGTVLLTSSADHVAQLYAVRRYEAPIPPATAFVGWGIPRLPL